MTASEPFAIKIDLLQGFIVIFLMLFLIWNTLQSYRAAPTARAKKQLHGRTVVLCAVGGVAIVAVLVLMVLSLSGG